MAFNFPNSPTLNQIYAASGKTWKWNGYAWAVVDANLYAVFTASTTAPLNPNAGDRWLKTDEGIEYTWYIDNDGGQWVDLNSGTNTIANTLTAPAFSAYQSTLQSLVTGADRKVQFQTEDFDSANCFDNVTNYRFTPNVSGWYQIQGAVSGAFGSNTNVSVIIYKNGIPEAYSTIDSSAGTTTGLNVQKLVFLNGTTDYVELFCNPGNTTQNSTIGRAFTWFQGYFVRS